MKQLILSLFFLFICGSVEADEGKTHAISQKNKKFSELKISINQGDTVSFTNEDDTTHHLMYKLDGVRVSKRQKAGDPPHLQKFDKPGNVKVRCAIHPKMKLEITIK